MENKDYKAYQGDPMIMGKWGPTGANGSRQTLRSKANRANIAYFNSPPLYHSNA